MSRFFEGLLADEAGTTAIEYALIGTLVGVACITAFQNFSAATGVFYAIIESIAVVL